MKSNLAASLKMNDIRRTSFHQSGIKVGLEGLHPSMIGAKKKSEPLVGIEDYPVKRPTLDGVTMEQVALTFNPKDYETNEWCPIYQIAKTSHGGIVYFAAINDSVDMIHEYVGLLDTLYEANANDIIEINISSPGGYIATATQICSAINSCKGSVITHASGICASAGSLIWSVGHEVTVGDNALFMWHMSSHFDCGNSLAIKDEAEFQVNYVRDALLSISLKRGFITEEEIARICSNPDETVWIGADEMRERCSKARSDGRLSAQVPHLLSGKAEPAAAVPAEVIGD